MSYNKPLPQVNADNRPFWEACREHRLKIQQCESCGHLRWPPAFLCPRCHSQQTKWAAVSGKGSIYTYAVYHQAFQPGFEEEVPYVVAIIELAEGPRMMTNIIDCDPEALCCGLPVEVKWEDATEEWSIPRFRPARA